MKKVSQAIAKMKIREFTHSQVVALNRAMVDIRDGKWTDADKSDFLDLYSDYSAVLSEVCSLCRM